MNAEVKTDDQSQRKLKNGLDSHNKITYAVKHPNWL